MTSKELRDKIYEVLREEIGQHLSDSVTKTCLESINGRLEHLLDDLEQEAFDRGTKAEGLY